MSSSIRTLAVAATAVAWLPPIAYGWRWSAYSPVRDYISELGAAGAPDAAPVNGAFLAAGGLFVLLCLVLARQWPIARWPLALISAVGWSYVVAAFVPCDPGCPAEGSPTQALHNAVGALGYLAGGVGLLMARRPTGAAGRRGLAWSAGAAGVTALAGLVAMGVPELADVRGAAQRVVELGIFAWLLALAWSVDATSASSSPRPTSGPA